MFSAPKTSVKFVRFILGRRRKYNKGKILSLDEEQTEIIRKGNFYVDQLLKDLTPHWSKLDPYRLEDILTGPSIGNYFSAGLEAKLHGLRTLRRAGVCSLTESDGKMRITADIGVRSLQIEYKAHATFMNFGPAIIVCANLENLEFYLTFTVDASTGKDAVLNKVYVDNVKHFKMWIDGLGPLTWIVNEVLNRLQICFQNRIIDLLTGYFVHFLRGFISNHTFPNKKLVFKNPQRHAALTPKCKKLSTIQEDSVLELSDNELKFEKLLSLLY